MFTQWRRRQSLIQIVGLAIVLCLISAFLLHAVDFGHVHPNDVVPHAHHEHTPALSVHAEEKSLWFFLILLAMVGLAAWAAASFAVRPAVCPIGRLPRTRQKIRRSVFQYGINPQIE